MIDVPVLDDQPIKDDPILVLEDPILKVNPEADSIDAIEDAEQIGEDDPEEE